MPRQRMHKPELITHGPFTECSLNAQLLLILLQNFCDDNGNCPVHLRSIKAQVFPCHDVTIDEVKGLIEELLCHEILIEYEVENKHFYHVFGWNIKGHPLHQTINHPTTAQCPTYEDSLRTPVVIHEESPTIKYKLSKVKLSEVKHMIKSDRFDRDRFDRFWFAYPKKVGKEGALRIWKTKKLCKHIEEILSDLDQRKDWNKYNKYVPYPSTYLNGKRWEDEDKQSNDESNPDKKNSRKDESLSQAAIRIVQERNKNKNTEFL